MIPKPVTIQLTVTAIHLTSPKVNCKLKTRLVSPTETLVIRR
jgi:hypothetical protein